MIDKYLTVKSKYRSSIVLVKSGSFWNTFYADAFIVHHLTGYLLKNNRVGFPSKVLNKVLKIIGSLNISYVIVYELDDIIVHEYISNLYTFYLDLYQKRLKS